MSFCCFYYATVGLPQVRPSLGVRRIGPRQNCLPTIDLTIGTLQQQANENRRAEVVCSSGFSAFSRETIQEDAAFLTTEKAQIISVINDEQNKPCTFSAEDALKDIELFSESCGALMVPTICMKKLIGMQRLILCETISKTPPRRSPLPMSWAANCCAPTAL